LDSTVAPGHWNTKKLHIVSAKIYPKNTHYWGLLEISDIYMVKIIHIMKSSIRFASALLAVFTFANPIPALATPVTFTILDSYTGRVPAGTNYQQLTYYNQYVDAGSVDASPFVIDKLTGNFGGILFYGSTELISKSNANTFRLTSTTGRFDFTSFDLQRLETYADEYTESTIPQITITSSTGFTQSLAATLMVETFEFMGEVYTDYYYEFEDTGVQTMNWQNVEWVDFTTQHAKAHTSHYVMTLNDFSAGTISLSAANSTLASVSGTATVNVSGANVTIAEVSGGTVNVEAEGATIQSYTGGNVAVGDGLEATMQNGVSSGVISGEGGLTKSSAGVLTLDGANTYTGATTVSTGILLVNGSIPAGSTFSVAEGAVLGGNGTISGDLTLAEGALLAFDTAYTLTLAGALSLNSSFGVASLRNINGGEIDWAVIAEGTYTIMNTSFDFSTINIANFGAANAFDIGGGRSAYFQNGSLQLVVVPEPSAWALLTVSLTILIIFRRRRLAHGLLETRKLELRLKNYRANDKREQAKTGSSTVIG